MSYMDAKRSVASGMARPVMALVVVWLLLLPLAAGQTDREALLAFKAGVTGDPSGVLQSWNDTVDFCQWTGVNCTAGRVTILDVSSRRLAGTISPAIGNLTQLQTFNLTSNGFSGSIPASLGQLRRLTYISLCDNAFTGEIPGALRGCSSLSTAYLNNNYLTGSIPNSLGTMPNLAILKLSHNSLSGRIPPSLGNLTRLQYLELDQNLLEGTIPDGLTRLPSLVRFSVYQNNITGEIPWGFFNMLSLQAISLVNNAFHGELPPDAGVRSPNLMYLFLAGNRLSGRIPASLANATNLQALSLANNSFTGQVPPEIGKLCPSVIQLSNNELTASDAGGWEFLDSLTSCEALTEVSLDGNKLGGAMPSSIARLSPQLQVLNLAGNRISGAIPPGIGNLVGLDKLDLHSNLLTGAVPVGIGKLNNLQWLDLHGNRLTGQVPSAIGSLTQLLSLDLSNNLFNGSIPPSLGNLQKLNRLDLSGNGLSGPVPRELFGLTSLSLMLDLSDNQLDGLLPGGVGQLTNLALVALSGNRFSGEVPAELGRCASLEFLDLDSNSFTGSIPLSLSKLKGLRGLNLTSNRLSGAIPSELSQMSGLQELYLSWNSLSGSIPASLDKMSSLIELDLSHNNLGGQVPLHGVFANMTGFQMTGNSELCGGAPQLKLSPCPPARANSIRGVPLILLIALPVIAVALCFAVLLTVLHWRKKKSRTTNTEDPTDLNGNDYPRVTYAQLAKATENFADANLVGAGKYGSVYCGILSLKAKKASVQEDVVVAVKVFDLRQVGGSKTFMSECEALRSIRHRNLIRIITCCSSADAEGNEFRALVFDFMPNFSLDRWLHPDPLELSKGFGCLSIRQRLNIVVDVADALNYLHNSCEPPVVHCDLKPSNILLGEDMTAYIGDFGLAKLVLDPASHAAGNSESTIGIRGTIGYVAPEYGTTGNVSSFGDVYSFGITLLEIFVGRAPTSDEFRDGLTLPEFVGRAFPDGIEQILDPALLPIEELDGAMSPRSDEESKARVTAHDCLVSAVGVGLNCSRRAPYERMVMKDAAAEMRRIRDAWLRGKNSEV